VSNAGKPGHKRRKVLVSIAALVVGLAGLGVRIVELIEELN